MKDITQHKTWLFGSWLCKYAETKCFERTQYKQWRQRCIPLLKLLCIVNLLPTFKTLRHYSAEEEHVLQDAETKFKWTIIDVLGDCIVDTSRIMCIGKEIW
jgi:hypothetical protein